MASLLADLGHEVPTSLLPSFLTSTLGAPAAALGLIEGLPTASLAPRGSAAAHSLTIRTDGARRDGRLHRDRRPLLVIGVATAAWQVGVLRAGAGLLEGCASRPASTAADAVPPAAYGRAYGFERACDNLGASEGHTRARPRCPGGGRTSILLSVIPGLLAAVAILWRDPRRPAPEVRQHQPIRLRIRPVLHGQLGRLMIGVSAFESATPPPRC